MSLLEKIIHNREKILAIAEKYGVCDIRVFGSVSRGQENKSSDIDFLVDLVEGTEGNYIEFALEVGKLLKKKVQVCTPETLHPGFKDKVLKKAVSIMEDDPVLAEKEKDERNYRINVEKTLKYVKSFWEFIEKYSKEDVVRNDEIRRMFRSTVQEPVEEIVRNISPKIKQKIPEIDWVDLRYFRNFIVHHYEDVDWGLMWDVSQKKIKVVEEGCKRILEVLGEEERR